MGKYHNDQPIKGNADDPDLLNRKNFAEHLADILLLNSDDDCLTVSLEGEWGYGKTSVINLIKTVLKTKKNVPVIIEYNPWLAGKPESLIQDFLLQFSSQLNISENSEDALKASKELIAYSSLFSVAKLVPGIEPWASIVEKIFSRFSNTTKKIAELKKLDLLSRKTQVVSAIKKIETPIIVIIDDIDRLTPSETFQVLRLVKAVADFSGTAFLLAFDPSYLSSVLNKNDIENSSEYINKVIQLRVPLPIISNRDMNKLTEIEFKELSNQNLTSQFDKDQERLSWIYHNYFRHLILNPRELKRFFNHLRFVFEQVKGEVCFTDLFALSLLATKARQSYEHIKKTPEAYIGKRLDNDLMIKKAEDVVKSLNKERELQLNSFGESEKELIKGLLGDIFPLIDSGSFSHYGVSDDDDAAGRISAPQRLHIALHYKTPTGYISDQDIMGFIEGSVDRAKFIRDVFKNNADERFFEMMRHYSSECKHNSFEILTSIYDATFNSKQLKEAFERNYGFMSNNPFQKMMWLTNKVISDCDDKSKLITDIVKRSSNAAISADLLLKIRNQIHSKKKNNNNDEPWVTEKQLDSIEGYFQSSAISALSEKLFVNNHLESHIFFELRRSSKEKTAKFISSILAEEKGIIRVAEIIGNTGSDSTNGPYVKIDDEFGDVIDMDLLRNKAKDISNNDHPPHITAVMNSILTGKQYYLRDGTVRKEW